MTYATEIENKKFKHNIVIRFLSNYYCIHQPDSGLTVPATGLGVVKGLVLNPTSVDLRKPESTIAQYSFRILDKVVNGLPIITSQLQNNASLFVGAEVEIWVGRITGSFPFSNYFKLPITRIKKVDYIDNSYNFTSVEATDRMNLPIFNVVDTLNADITSGQTTITAQGFIDDFPAAGTFLIDKELITYTSKNDGTRQFLGCSRGTNGTDATTHAAATEIKNVVEITDNPLTILLKLLISNGGGGTYDTLADGLGISNTLIDVTAIEAIRTANFNGEQFKFFLYGIENALQFIEKEILQACNLRFTVSANSKISVALLDQSVFGDAPAEITDNSIVGQPQWTVGENKIVNAILVDWDYDEGMGVYLRRSEYTDTDSITTFGRRPTLKLKWKGIRFSLSGQDIVDDRGGRLLGRLSTPTPEINVKTHLDKSLINVGDKILFQSSKTPAPDGSLMLQTELEVLSRAINHINGDVNFKLAFTSYSGIRGCFIAPSDSIFTVVNQKTVTVASGRGAAYKVGWKMVLWDNVLRAYESDPANEIVDITNDQITFADNFATTLIAGDHRLKFPDYDEATEDQHRYCFISDQGNDFSDASGTYRITF